MIHSDLLKHKQKDIYQWVNSTPICFSYQLLQTTFELSKIAKFWISMSISYVKDYPNLSQLFFFVKQYHFRGIFFVFCIFWKLQFLKHLIFKNDVQLVWSNWYQKTSAQNWYILDRVRRSLWIITTLVTLVVD